jgi:hypothetical protein
MGIAAWLAGCMLVAAVARADETPGVPDPLESKVDTVLVQQRQLLEGQQRVLAAVEREDPFLTRRHAVAFNVPLAIATAGREVQVLSGGLCWFPPDSPLEIVVPVWWRRDRDGSVALPNGHRDDYDFTGLTIDLQGRWYLDPLRSGWYFTGGLRWAHLEGYVDDDEYWITLWPGSTGRDTVDKLGLYAGIGWRAESSRLYWGWNIVAGRYLGNTEPALHGDDLLGGDFLIDVEFFKFGILF